MQPKRTFENIQGILFFSVAVIITCLIFVFYITIKNECNTVQNEIYHLKNIQHTHQNRVKLLYSDLSSLMAPKYIEKKAHELFGMVSPSPESLYVVIGNIQ